MKKFLFSVLIFSTQAAFCMELSTTIVPSLEHPTKEFVKPLLTSFYNDTPSTYRLLQFDKRKLVVVPTDASKLINSLRFVNTSWFDTIDELDEEINHDFNEKYNISHMGAAFSLKQRILYTIMKVTFNVATDIKQADEHYKSDNPHLSEILTPYFVNATCFASPVINKTLINTAIDNNNISAVKIFIKHYAHLDNVKHCKLPLMQIAYLRACNAKPTFLLPIAELLLRNKANPDARTSIFDATALHTASNMEDKKYAQLLIKFGANPKIARLTYDATDTEKAAIIQQFPNNTTVEESCNFTDCCTWRWDNPSKGNPPLFNAFKPSLDSQDKTWLKDMYQNLINEDMQERNERIRHKRSVPKPHTNPASLRK